MELSWLYEQLVLSVELFSDLLYAPIVITGMHHSFIAVETQLLADMLKTGDHLFLQLQQCPM